MPNDVAFDSVRVTNVFEGAEAPMNTTPGNVTVDVDVFVVDPYASPTSPNTPICLTTAYCAPKEPDVVYVDDSPLIDETGELEDEDDDLAYTSRGLR